MYWRQNIVEIVFLSEKGKISVPCLLRVKSQRENMQKIILFIEPHKEAYRTPSKIGNLFMNRFAVDEDAASEILKIFELEKTSDKISDPYKNEYENFEEERKQKGMDLINKIDNLVCLTLIVKSWKTHPEIFLKFSISGS